MPFYFAYGSNMDRAAMAARCPRARMLGLARLERHRLALMREGYLTVMRDPRRAVHGLLWDLPLADMPALDRYEGVSAGLYTKMQQPVVGEAGIRKALVYLGTNAGSGAPAPGYLEGVLDAAVQAGLPPAALAEITALAGGRIGRPGPAAPARPPAGPVAAVRPTRATPRDAPRPATKPGWNWTP
ncbi:gamma-glutamylcyclotransferase family protein [Enterovirga rhinocerotis]|uniref:AIG2 family protein n=1 Tax=Enterovirga rhinocerotis TaxID=1339210 RepID=A0A4R7CAD8_9HYPH|nr:gamma-glutamylcyclotransferase family protein [Enterovirga rhinocerotis]TDR93757.1 AIG2 family protein [Enterovirga rhinocerotis]